MGLRYALFETPAGWMGVLASERGLREVRLPEGNREAIERSFSRYPDAQEVSPASFGDLPARLQAYFSGQPVEFPDAVDFASATAFRRQVWQATRSIPRGESRSYGALAAEIGKKGASRAVGQALADNPLPLVIPCHRVVGSTGALCGFAAGLDAKRRLLALEGIAR